MATFKKPFSKSRFFPQSLLLVSRPEEFHLQPLAKLSVNVSAHSASIIQPLEDIPLSSAPASPGSSWL